LEEFQARFEHIKQLKPRFTFLVNPFNANVVGSGVTDGGAREQAVSLAS